jgi:hypothetical protein
MLSGRPLRLVLLYFRAATLRIYTRRLAAQRYDKQRHRPTRRHWQAQAVFGHLQTVSARTCRSVRGRLDGHTPNRTHFLVFLAEE